MQKGKHEKRERRNDKINWRQTLIDFGFSVLAGLILKLIGKALNL